MTYERTRLGIWVDDAWICFAEEHEQSRREEDRNYSPQTLRNPLLVRRSAEQKADAEVTD